MKFSEYMQEWLYGENGYYTNFKAIGKSGDFYTAVSTSRFFGASIANYFYSLIKEDTSKRDGWLIEIGAHQGYLISDMIQWLYTVDKSLIDTLKFGIVEKEPKLQETQIEYIKSRFGNDVKIEHFNSLDEVKVDYAFFISNEIFDSFPCELIKDGQMAYVQNHKISWGEIDKNIADTAKRYRQVKGEVSIGFEDFAKRVFNSAKRCDFVSFDYGEKLVRNDFSIRVYTKHSVYPLFDEELKLEEVYKKADITYDVNFGHLIDSFLENGFKLKIYETQARALVRFGLIDILDMFRKNTTQSRYLREVDKIKTLIAPTIMGDKFKMIHFQK